MRLTVVRVRVGFGRGALLGSSRSSDSLWRAMRLQADLSRQLNCVSSDPLAGVKKCGLAGHVSEDA